MYRVGNANSIRGGYGSCGCGGPEVTSSTQLNKNRFGRGEWTVKMKNQEPFPVFITVATGEKVGQKSDFDTYARDIRIEPGCTAELKVPAGGNGICEGQPYRLTVRNKCDTSLGVVNGNFHDC